MKTLPGKTTKWPKANFPGQNERFLKLEKGLKEMALNFDKINASIETLRIAVDDANKRVSDLESEIAGYKADQAAVDAAAAAVTDEANKLPKTDLGGSTGGITA